MPALILIFVLLLICSLSVYVVFRTFTIHTRRRFMFGVFIFKHSFLTNYTDRCLLSKSWSYLLLMLHIDWLYASAVFKSFLRASFCSYVTTFKVKQFIWCRQTTVYDDCYSFFMFSSIFRINSQQWWILTNIIEILNENDM